MAATSLLGSSTGSFIPTNEIHYGAVNAVSGDQIGIGYRSPSGEENFVCSLANGNCNNAGEKFFPNKTRGATYALTSDNGKYGLAALGLNVGGNISVFYSLYDISSKNPQFVGLIPFYGAASNKYFTSDNKNIIFISKDNQILRYNIPSGNLESLSIPSIDLPFLTISPDGNYLSSYNYVNNSHRVYNLSSKNISEVKSSDPSYLEFGDNGQGAYKDNNGNFDALYAINAAINPAGNILPKKITNGNSSIQDYLFAGGHLFYLDNAGHPLRWSVNEYNFTTGTSSEVASNVSYGEYMKAQDGKLLYQKLDGKNANIYSYDPATRKTHEFAPAGSSTMTDTVTRTTMTMNNGRSAVLLSPKGDKGDNSGDLFIWLHGGPMRSVSVGYHSYLSYGVYDELLNRLAASGATVLKLDYTGSMGHGKALLNGLHGKVGVADVADVVAAAKELQGKDHFNNVYLIGNSYGGYLSLKSLVDNPQLFNGAISISPVTDWYGLISRIPSSPFKALFNGTPNSSNLTAYINSSIDGGIPNLPHNDKILLEYGEQDDEVPNRQSPEFIQFAHNFSNVNLDTIVFPD
jgi:pimeloyl-ACP methyl ester carboxylesterase